MRKDIVAIGLRPAIVGGVLYGTTKYFEDKSNEHSNLCDGNCNECSLVVNPNRVLSAVLNELFIEYGDGVADIVNKHCPHLTVCSDCKLDDFTHAEGCEIVANVILQSDAKTSFDVYLSKIMDYLNVQEIPDYALQVIEHYYLKGWEYQKTIKFITPLLLEASE